MVITIFLIGLRIQTPSPPPNNVWVSPLITNQNKILSRSNISDQTDSGMRPPCNQNILSNSRNVSSRVDSRFKSLNFRKIYFSRSLGFVTLKCFFVVSSTWKLCDQAGDWSCGHSQWRALNILIVSASFEHYGQFDRGTSIVNFTLEDTQLWWRHSDIQTNMTIIWDSAIT